MLYSFFKLMDNFFKDLLFIYFCFSKNLKKKKIKYPEIFLITVKEYLQKANDRRKYILKKYIYTINHKRIVIKLSI